MATTIPMAAGGPGRSPSNPSASTAVRAGERPVIGETLPRGPRRMASVVTPKARAIRAETPRAPGNADAGG